MRKMLRFFLWIAILGGVTVGVLRYFAIRWWHIPEDDPFLEASVAPTLRGGDLVILWRIGQPGFGDLVVCPEPDADNRIVIGRIAGEPGDRIKIDGSGFKINRTYVSTERACDPFRVSDPSTGMEVEQKCEIEVLAGRGHMRGSARAKKAQTKPFEVTVEEGQVFLLSDNRLYPYDSREFGLVERETCREQIVFRLVGKDGFSDVANRFTFIQ